MNHNGGKCARTGRYSMSMHLTYETVANWLQKHAETLLLYTANVAEEIIQRALNGRTRTRDVQYTRVALDLLNKLDDGSTARTLQRQKAMAFCIPRVGRQHAEGGASIDDIYANI